MSSKKFLSLVFFMLSSVAVAIPIESAAIAAQLQLSWTDNSSNEDGFKIERSTSATGTFAQIGLTGANVTTYNDSNLSAASTYCYRVRSYNAGGNSSYTSPSCATTSAGTFSLSIGKSGNGSGTVTSSPSSINCGPTCSVNFTAGAIVALTATAASGSTFAGWSGDSDCSDGSVTMNAGKSCTANFQLQAAPTPTLTITLVNTVTNLGTGSGSVSSSPAGIDCGQTCSADFPSGTNVWLVATPSAGSVFVGWSGVCQGTGKCRVKIKANLSVTATFAPHDVNLTISRRGNGKVYSIPSGIDCGVSCAGNYLSGSTVTLTPNPDPGFKFLGWSGGGCNGLETCTVALNANSAVTANFSTHVPSSIGVFRPSTGEWFFDDGNGAFDGCGVDTCITGFGQPQDLPAPGNWNNTGAILPGVFDSATGAWHLDLNGNQLLDGCELDTCSHVFGQAGDLPIVGDWTGNGQSRTGVFRPSTASWYFDLNGNGDLDSCVKNKVDACAKSFGQPGDLPVVGDWTGDGKTRMGVFSPSTGRWRLDKNGNRKKDKCNKDDCIASFGLPDDLPVVGDWDGNGKDNIGVFRPATGEWLLDANGNGQWDGCGVDICLGPFGQPGDLPIAGVW